MFKIENGDPDEPPKDASKGGYGKPPADKQFKKGKSGNPSGRPKKDKMFKSVSRVLRDCLLEEVEVSINGKPRKMLRVEAIVARQMSSALQGNVQSAKFLFTLAEKHIPTHLTLGEIMEGRPVFEFTEEEAARFTKAKIVEGMVPEDDEQPVL
jgi:hypothetical protein